jgi:hypothetical protein
MPRTAILTLGLLVLASGAEAQAPSVTLGDAVLRLGMSEAEVRLELAKHSSLFLSSDGEITNKSESEIGKENYLNGLYDYGDIGFTLGKLTHVEKHWRPSSDSPDTNVVIASALYGATDSVTGSAQKICRVRAWTSAEPEQDYKETTIECDALGATRGVHVFIKTFHFGEKEAHSVQVSETLDAR